MIYIETTWRKVSTLTAGIENAIKTEKEITEYNYSLFPIPSKKNELHKHAIERIAIINLKKLGGGAKTEEDKSQKTVDYSTHGIAFKKYIYQQIKEISPKIVVCCSPDVVTIVTNNILEREDKESYKTEEGIIVIKGFHPRASKSIKEYYEIPINNCLKLWKSI